MSSVQANETVSFDAKSKELFRRDSFDKLQSTANYSLQLAAAFLSRESLMQLFDAFVCQSRAILQKAVLLLSLPAFQMCCAVVLFWIDAFTKYTGINVAFEKKVVTTSTNVEPEKTYILRVQKRKFIADIPDQKVTETSTTMPTPNVSERLTPIAEMDLHVLPRQHSFTSGKIFRSDSDSDMGSNTSISNRNHNIGMVVIVYGSATFAYVQLMLLAVFLQSATTPPGLIFLVSSLAFIGYIVYKMCFVRAKSKEETNNSPVSSAPSSPPASKTDDSMKTSKTHQRLSRSMTRRFLYFHNKTLSKIKLL